MGAGKSTALATLERLGAAVLSTDAVVHELYATDAVRDAVHARLGDSVIVGGHIDRAAVARLVFADPVQRRWLEALLWPLVSDRIVAFRLAANRRVPRPRAVVVETPLLFEAGLDTSYDATIAIVADERVRAGRASGRDHESLREREQRQLSQEEKARRATYVVPNSGSLEDLTAELAGLIETVARSAPPGIPR